MIVPFGGQDILRVVNTPNIPDPIPGSREFESAIKRDESTRSTAGMTWLPQLPETWAEELHDRIEDAERTYAAPNLQTSDYEKGIAEAPDEIAVIEGDGTYLFTAEHATSPFSLKEQKMRYPDTGTGGLAAVLGEDYGTALIMRGQQTSNVPSDPEHPIKPLIRHELTQATGFLAVHGKAPGMFVHMDDESEIHACIGLGREPSEAMREFAQKIVLAARDELGLYVVISNDQPTYIQRRASTELKRLDDGSPKLSQLAASKPKDSSTTFANRVLHETNHAIPALQMELTNLLRLTPQDGDIHKDKTSRVIGVAMGYLLSKKVVDLTPVYSTLTN